METKYKVDVQLQNMERIIKDVSDFKIWFIFNRENFTAQERAKFKDVWNDIVHLQLDYDTFLKTYNERGNMHFNNTLQAFTGKQKTLQ